MQISTWKHMDNCKNQTWCSEHYRIMAPILVLFKTSKAKYNSTGWFKKKKKKQQQKHQQNRPRNTKQHLTRPSSFLSHVARLSSHTAVLSKAGDLNKHIHLTFQT